MVYKVYYTIESRHNSCTQNKAIQGKNGLYKSPQPLLKPTEKVILI